LVFGGWRGARGERLYGVMSSPVSQSSRELALRMVLGASPESSGLVLVEGSRPDRGGLGLGLIAGAEVTRRWVTSVCR